MAPRDPAVLVDGRRLLVALGSRAWLFVVLGLIGAASGLLLHSSASKQYSATAEIQVGYDAVDSLIQGQNLPYADPKILQSTQAAVLSSDLIADKAAAVLHRKPSVTINSVTDSALVAVTASGADAQQAARAANTYVDVYLAYLRQQADLHFRTLQAHLQNSVDTETKQLGKIRHNTTNVAAISLRLRLTQDTNLLATVSSALASDPIPASRASTAQVPTGPSGLSGSQYLAFGAALGLIAAAALALIADSRDDRLRTPEAIEAETGLPVFGTIEATKRRRRAGGSADIAANQVLRHLPAPRGKIVVVELVEGSGADRMSVRLAQAADSSERTVAVLDVASGDLIFMSSTIKAPERLGVLNPTLPLRQRIATLQRIVHVVFLSSPALETSPQAVQATEGADVAIIAVKSAQVSARRLAATAETLRRLGVPSVGVISLTGEPVQHRMTLQPEHEYEPEQERAQVANATRPSPGR